ncbi:MAG TPA: AraC family transcriptional regulator, partial [Clostridia bacterium]|nr:AraC family transcriptional regulator [Clostridia bacterium]
LRKNSETILSNTTQVYTPIVVDMINYIQENFRTVSLKELANTFNYSPDFVGKLIKNHTGVSFMQILQDVRFKKACSLLVSTNLRVIDICCQIGYESVEFFTRRFKELYGKTPAEYRNQSISSSFSS